MSTGDPEQENHLTSRINQEIDKTKILLQDNNETDVQHVATREERLPKEKETAVVIFSSDSAQSLKTSENVDVNKGESNGSAEHLSNDKHPEESLKDKPWKQSEHQVKVHEEMNDADKFDLDNKPVRDALVENTEDDASTAIAGSGNVTESIVNCVVQPEGISDVVPQDNKMQKEAETIPVDLHVSTAETVVCEKSEVSREDSLVEQSHSHGTSTKEVEGASDLEAFNKKQGPEGDNPVEIKEPSGTEITQLVDGSAKGTSSSPVKENEETAASKTVWYTDDNASTRPQSVPEEMSPGETTEEVSYSTTVVGGVVHRTPISSSSPKAQQKSSSSPQSGTEKKKSFIETLFGHRTKSRDASSPAVVPGGKDGENVNVDGQEKDHMLHQTEKSADVGGQDGSVVLANGTAKEGSDTNGLDIIHKRDDKTAHPAKIEKSTLINPAEQSGDNSAKEEVVAVLKSGDVPCEPNDVETSVSQDVQTLEEKTLEVEQSKDSTVETVFINSKSDVTIEEQDGQEISQKEAEAVEPIAEQDNEAVERNAVESKPMVEELKVDGSSEETAVQEAQYRAAKPAAEKVLSSESKANQDEDDDALKKRVIRREANPSHSPKARRMQMRISYAEGGSGKGGKEVEVISTPEGIPESAATQKAGKTPPDHRVPCRALGDADHEGWLSKKGGSLFFSTWKRKWVVLKEGKLYYYKTSFDQEASGIITMEDATVAAAPETKKNFCFKCVQPGPKPQVTLFMAESQEDMEKWLSVLSAASRGEGIQKSRQYLPVNDDALQKRKSASNPKQRTSSVLAVGGCHDFLEEEENCFATRRRSSHESTPEAASPGISSPEKGIFGSDKETSEAGETRRAYQPADDGQNDKKESERLASSEKPAIVECEVLAISETVVESSFDVKQSSTDQEVPAVDSTDSVKPVDLSHEEDKETAKKANTSVVESVTETASCATQKESLLDVEQTTGLTMDKPDMEAENSIIRVETEQHTSANVSENTDNETMAVETDSTVRQESNETDPAPLKVNNYVEESRQPPKKLPPKPDSSVSLSSEPASPSKTEWYFILDENEGWSVPNQPEVHRHPLPSTSSDSTTDVDSVKSVPRESAVEDDDQLLAMCRNIREARLSIVGLPLWEGTDRVRALSSVGEKGGKIVKLKTLERTLKDKERALSRLEELLAHDPEVNKHSLHEWTVRHSDLFDELVSHKEGEGKKETFKQGEDKENIEHENVIENSETFDIRSANEETVREEMTGERGCKQISSGDLIQNEEEKEGENLFSQTVGDDNKEGEEEGKNDTQPAHQEGEGERKEEVQQQNKASKDSEDGEGTQSPGDSSAEITLVTEAVVTAQEITAEHGKERIDDHSPLEEHGESEKESFLIGSGDAVLSENNHAMEGEENGQGEENTRL